MIYIVEYFLSYLLWVYKKNGNQNINLSEKYGKFVQKPLTWQDESLTFYENIKKHPRLQILSVFYLFSKWGASVVKDRTFDLLDYMILNKEEVKELIYKIDKLLKN